MRYPRNLEIGFELEFGHDITKKEVVRIVSKAFPDVRWGGGKHRFQLVDDGSVWTKRKNDSELITPAWPAREAIENLQKLFKLLDDIGATTDKTTGLHVNIGWKNANTISDISPLKVLVYSNEEKWLKHFDRESNRWCRAYRYPVANRASGFVYDHRFVARIENVMDTLNNTKNRFINFDKAEYGYIEFRGIGGVNYHKKRKTVLRAIDDFIYALNIARYEDQDDYKRKLKAYLLGVL